MTGGNRAFVGQMRWSFEWTLKSREVCQSIAVSKNHLPHLTTFDFNKTTLAWALLLRVLASQFNYQSQPPCFWRLGKLVLKASRDFPGYLSIIGWLQRNLPSSGMVLYWGLPISWGALGVCQIALWDPVWFFHHCTLRLENDNGLLLLCLFIWLQSFHSLSLDWKAPKLKLGTEDGFMTYRKLGMLAAF